MAQQRPHGRGLHGAFRGVRLRVGGRKPAASLLFALPGTLAEDDFDIIQRARRISSMQASAPRRLDQRDLLRLELPPCLGRNHARPVPRAGPRSPVQNRDLNGLRPFGAQLPGKRFSSSLAAA